MKPSKTLSILIPCLKSRPYKLIWSELERQRKNLPNPDSVEIILSIDNGESTSGAKRNALTQKSVGEYIAFVDDDDKVVEDYLPSLLEGCSHNPDVVAFNLQFTRIDNPNLNEVWKLGLNGSLRKKGLMPINHLCPWKREIATKVAWCPDLGNGDDQLWFKPLLAANLVSNVHRIDRTLYYYQYDPIITANQTQSMIDKRRVYAKNGLRCFMIDGEIWIEVPSSPTRNIIQARNRFNKVVRKPNKNWPKPYAIVRIG